MSDERVFVRGDARVTTANPTAVTQLLAEGYEEQTDQPGATAQQAAQQDTGTAQSSRGGSTAQRSRRAGSGETTETGQGGSETPSE